jgi:allantoicase
LIPIFSKETIPRVVWYDVCIEWNRIDQRLNNINSFQVEGCLLGPCSEADEKAALENAEWKTILARTRLGPHAIHNFSVSDQSTVSDFLISRFVHCRYCLLINILMFYIDV